MKRFFRNSGLATFLSFLLVFVAMEATVRKVRANLPVDPGKWPRIEIAQKLDLMDRAVAQRKRFDVVFAGSSVIAGGIDPVEFTKASGISSFNAAWAGATARTSALWVDDVVVPLLHPRVVVLGIQTAEINDNGPKNQITYRKFITSPGYEQTTSKFTRRVESWLENLSDFIRYRLAFRTPTALFDKDRAALAGTEVRKVIGARGRRVEEPRTYHFRDKFKENFYAKNLVDLSFGGREYRALVRLERALRARGAKLVLIGTPATDDYYSVHDDPEGDKARFKALLARFHRETRATVVDAVDAVPGSIPFRDPVHLDVEARGPFSRALARDWGELSAERGGFFEMTCTGAVVPDCSVSRR